MSPIPSRRRAASAQEQLPLEEIVGDVIRLRGGECRAVLQAGCVNFALKSESEQDAILAAYRRFLNSLAYPLQVLIRVVPTNVGAYLAAIEDGQPERSETLRRLARDHAAFVRRIARERTLLDRRFYVIVPAGSHDAPSRRGLAWPWRSASRAQVHLDLLADRRQLAFRCSELGQGLAALGVSTRRLDERELAALWGATLAGTATRQADGAPRPAPAVVATRRMEVARA